MSARRVPTAAAWLLKVFKVTENNPPLIGDLNEEFLSGHSSVWLWRQVLAAIVFGIGKEIYGHRMPIGAILTGEVAVLLSSSALAVAMESRWFLTAVLSRFPSAEWYWVASPAIACLAGGWIVFRFQAERRSALVLLFAILQFILLLWSGDLHRLLVDSISDPRFRAYLWLRAPALICCPLAVLAGGYLGRYRAEHRSR